MVRIIADLASDWRQLDERIEPVTDEIETLAKSDSSCRRVMTVPGIGPIISSAMVAAIGSGAAFARGRDFSAWIGLVPKQMSTGDRTILGRISKRGNGYLRTLFMQAARVILLRPASWPKHGFGVWLARAAQRLHPNVLAAALANKLARIAWTVLAQERSYEAARHQGGGLKRISKPIVELAFPPRSASRNEEMEKGLASAFVIRWPVWPSGPRRE